MFKRPFHRCKFINCSWFIEQAWETVFKPFTMKICEVILIFTNYLWKRDVFFAEFTFLQTCGNTYCAFKSIQTPWLFPQFVTLQPYSKMYVIDFIHFLWMSLSGPARARTWTQSAVQRRSLSNLTELERICREEWEKLPKYWCAKLVASYTRRRVCNCCQRCFNKVLSKGSEYLHMQKWYFNLFFA